jgi:hypothetical protein
MDNMSLTEKLRAMLHYKKSAEFYAKKLGVSVAEIKQILQGNRRGVEYTTKIDVKEDAVNSEITLDFEPKSVEELYELHKIDKEKYKIVNYWSKLKSSGRFTSSVFAVSKKNVQYTAEDFANFLKDYKPPVIKIIKTKEQGINKELVDAEISIADFHLGKKTKEIESVKERKEFYLKIVRQLVLKASKIFNINKLVFVISNDFFHTDTFHNTTTNGTPQDVLTDFANEYEEGFDLLVQALSFVESYAKKVEVVLVQGNHDRTKSFYLAHALEIFFSRNKKIEFQRHSSVTKHVILGNTFIGYHHGNCKIEQLPLLFATGDAAVEFGKAKYREIHTGDKHHYMAKEIKGVRMQQMPSLSGTDRWHEDHNYVNNIRSALMLIYHPVAGKVAEFEERISI